MSAVSPQAGIVHAREPATDRHWPRISTGNESSASPHHRFLFAADQFPGSHSNHSQLCPHLTQPQFARRSRNSRRAVRRSSRICSRQRMSSRSCDKNARRIVPSPTCSRSTACRPARPPSPYSVIKCSVKPFGHANGQDESGQPPTSGNGGEIASDSVPAAEAGIPAEPSTNPNGNEAPPTRTRGPRIAQVRMLKPQTT